MSTLYLVATPIGNLEDISPRALRTLREVPLIAAEDTRHSGKLLSHFGISTRLTSYHDHNKGLKLEPILDALQNHDVALISDAGTPTINDPGYELVNAALAAGHTVTPIPGPSAPIAALSVSGLPTDAFLYLGYLPRKQSERQTFIAQIVILPYTLVFLETPHRLLEALTDLQTLLGDRKIAVARELTKMFEEIYRGPISAALAHFSAQPQRGELTLVVAGAPPEEGRWSESRLRAELRNRLDAGDSPSYLAKELAKDAGWSKKEVYSLLLEMEKSQ
ncbi:MAG: 16S rRNA (cytidine(1402)-2'-O)-methyltransferase [Anaerolineales bacterium]|nr:16S rRNA (cytidine(1402)-2'-O)-methyltransferase [Anaerolineales bacterium]